MNQQTTTGGSPRKLTLQSATSYLWRVDCRIVGMAYAHAWAGEATDSMDARTQAMAAARRDWPGCSIAVTSVVQVA